MPGTLVRYANRVVIVGSDGITEWEPATLGNAAAPVAPATATATGSLLMGGQYNSTKPTWTDGQQGRLSLDARGNVDVGPYFPGTALPFAGAADNADAVATTSSTNRLAVMSRNSIFNGSSWDRESVATTTARLIAAANSTNATNVKASAGKLWKLSGWNAGTVSYLKIYNKATAPTVGTDTPILTIYLAASATFNLDFNGLYFGTGIGYGLTTGGTDGDTTAVAANAVLAMNVVYS